jgi:hypothetical protein
MATPVIDLRARLRGAGLNEGQADAIAAGFETLDRRMGEIESRLARVEGRMRLLQWVFGVLLGAVIALEATILGVVLNLLSRLPGP